MNGIPSTHRPSLRRQRGVVLVVSLLMLLVLTLIGLAATRASTVEQRLTTNQHDLAVATQGAEAALRDGESLLNSAGLPDFAQNTGGAYTASTMTVDWKTINWDDPAATLAYEGAFGSTGVPAQTPRYFVVLTNMPVNTLGTSQSTQDAEGSETVYYVYAHSYGLSTNSSVVLQSTYAR